MKSSHVVNPLVGSTTGMMWSMCMSVLPKVLAHEAHLYVFLAMRAAAFESFFGAHLPLARRNAETMKPRFRAAVHRPPQCSFAGALDAITDS
jgi:hypothetical protein